MVKKKGNANSVRGWLSDVKRVPTVTSNWRPPLQLPTPKVCSVKHR